MEGYPAGFGISAMGGEEYQGAINSNLYRLWEKEGSVDQLLDAVEDDLYPALVRDMRKANKTVTENVRRQDSLIGANFWLSIYGDAREREEAANRLSILMDLQQANYLAVFRRNATLRELGLEE